MRQQIAALGGVGAAALLGFFLLSGAVDTKSLSAMEKMAEKVRKAKSYKAVMIAESQFIPESGKPPVKHEQTGTIYWLAQGLSRADYKGLALVNSAQEEDITKIDLPDESREAALREITVDHKAKTFRSDALPKGSPAAVLITEMMEKLGEFRGQADRELGTKETNGKKSRGFEVDMRKLRMRPKDAGASERWMTEIWIDTESSLPVLVQLKMTMDRMELAVRFQDLQWNIDLDPKLFDPTLPKGYTDITSSVHVPPEPDGARTGTP